MAFAFVRTATLSGEYVWVSPTDPAFDPTAEGFSQEALAEALEGQHHERISAWLRPNEKPTRWKLKHIGDAGHRYLWDQHQRLSPKATVSAVVLRDACSLGLVGVDDLTGKDGRPFKITHRPHPECGLSAVSHEVMEELAALDGGDLVSLIGLHVMFGRAPSGN